MTLRKDIAHRFVFNRHHLKVRGRTLSQIANVVVSRERQTVRGLPWPALIVAERLNWVGRFEKVNLPLCPPRNPLKACGQYRPDHFRIG
jgi:hypothetical protein